MVFYVVTEIRLIRHVVAAIIIEKIVPS